MSKRILRLPAVLDKIGLGRSAIYRLIKDKKFPAPVPLSERTVGWIEAEIDTWLDTRVGTRNREYSRPQKS